MKVANKKIKVLFFAESATLAHVTRPYVLANELDPDKYEVHFASSDSYSYLLENTNFRRHLISSISTADFNKRLANGKSLYSLYTLEKYVSEDLDIIADVKPDLIVGDLRLSLAVSARLAKVPYISISNAYWSPYSNSKSYPVPEHPLTKIFGVQLVKKLFPIIQPIAFKMNLLPFRLLKLRYGMRAPETLKEAYTDADYVLYPDMPNLVPTNDLPDNHRYIRPILWAPNVELPEWTKTCGEGKKVFVSLGTTGDISKLLTVIETLTTLNCKVLVATAARTQLPATANNVHLEEFVDGIAAAKWADLVICNGGSGTVYQAIAGNTPILGVCSNMDQFMNMEHVVNIGAGAIIRAGHLSEKTIESTVTALLTKETYKQTSRELADSFSNISNSSLFGEFIDQLAKTNIALEPLPLLTVANGENANAMQEYSDARPKFKSFSLLT